MEASEMLADENREREMKRSFLADTLVEGEDLDEDLLSAATGAVRNQRRVDLDEILAPPAAKSYRTKPRPMGLRPGFSYDNISELSAAAEGEDHP
jgi:hypothetical protein